MSTRGFFGLRRKQPPRPIPPGQYYEEGFPVLTAGPTQRIETTSWDFSIHDNDAKLASWTWDEFQALPQEDIHTDIHCVTKWSKLDTDWKGVSVDTLFEKGGVEPDADYAMAFSDGGYTTNLPVEDIIDGKAFLVHEFDGEPLPAEHGGPVRLLVPHLYFWKSAKWVRGLRLMDQDAPGFWEAYGYHMYGDPWSEQRYSGD